MPRKAIPYELGQLKKIRMIAIQAMFSDDFLLDNLVLKGGNALDLIYKMNSRSSVDLDFSMERDFDSGALEEIEKKIKQALVVTFRENGYEVIDFSFEQKPSPVPDDQLPFWGGYVVEFKITNIFFAQASKGIKQARQTAFPLGEGEKKALVIEISKFEFVEPKNDVEIDDIKIYIYTPAMILFEKLRAICQQTEEYSEIVKRAYSCKARAKDFYDISAIFEKFSIDVTSDDSLSTLKAIFQSKKVPLHLIGKIELSRELHRQDFKSVESTVWDRANLKDFDYYFNRVLEIIRPMLKSLGVK